MRARSRLTPVLLLALSLAAADAAAVGGEGGTAPFHGPKLPPVKRIDSVLYYPVAARKLGLEGRVELEFSIGGDGKPRRAAVILADDPLLARQAHTLLAAMLFDVPKEWRASGLESTRYRLGMVFCLPPSGQTQQFPEPISSMIITAERISGAPVKHPVQPGSFGRCARAS